MLASVLLGKQGHGNEPGKGFGLLVWPSGVCVDSQPKMFQIQAWVYAHTARLLPTAQGWGFFAAQHMDAAMCPIS